MKMAAWVIAWFMGVGAMFGVMNTMFAAIAQRTKDIAVLRIMGYEAVHILLSFLFEATLIAALGGGLGLALGCAANGFTQSASLGARQIDFSFRVDAAIVAFAAAFTVALGLLGGVLPGLSAMRIKPLEALRREQDSYLPARSASKGVPCWRCGLATESTSGDLMHALLVSAGTAGNMLPFIGLAAALRARGHDATLIGSGSGTDALCALGVGFADLEEPGAGRELSEADSATVHKPSFLGSLVPRAVRYMRKVYQLIAERHVPGETVVVSQGWLFGSRIAQEMLGVPLATVQLQPLLFGSACDTPGLPRWVPRCVPRLVNRVVERSVDWALAKAIDTFRAELGLRPARRPVTHWWRSPELVIGFFPEWYSASQPDWPHQAILGGFPLYDAPGAAVPPDLEDFLADGEPPLVFSQASLNRDAKDYFAASAAVSRRLGRRAVLLTSHPEQLPRSLPAGVRHFGFVPLSRLLPRAAAIVHHGGMGTLGQALAAGIPQLTVPVMLDQFDNSRRLLRLGVSANMRAIAFHPERVTRILRGLLESPKVHERCRNYAARMREERPFDRVCVALEQMHGCGSKRPE